MMSPGLEGTRVVPNAEGDVGGDPFTHLDRKLRLFVRDSGKIFLDSANSQVSGLAQIADHIRRFRIVRARRVYLEWEVSASPAHPTGERARHPPLARVRRSNSPLPTMTSP
ncbi:Uncharacterised protein [Mycobacteroides abscessus subsp. abscessus]|nr:Uncharacterised protein [Mycobacteroides abscessus subsp. abscessus]